MDGTTVSSLRSIRSGAGGGGVGSRMSTGEDIKEESEPEEDVRW